MTTQRIAEIVAAALAPAIEAAHAAIDYLEDIARHGIHNITNDYHGTSDDEYEAFSAEFERQAKAALREIDNARMAEFRNA